MVDLVALPLDVILDARDRDSLSNMLKPLSNEAYSIKTFSTLSTIATIPTVTLESFVLAIDKAKQDLDKLLDINRQAQAIVKSFTPAHPIVTLTHGQPTEIK